MTWTTVRLRVVTPLFGGDEPGSASDPIRVPSIRGALRFWFRAVAAGHGISTLEALWEAEQDVFGSTTCPSPIQLRVDDHVLASGRASKPSWANTWGGKYLLGQGLWDSNSGLIRGFVAPGTRFALRVRLSGDHNRDRKFVLAMWAWLTYGGLGARTRRGFGRLLCEGVEGPLPLGWKPADLGAPRTVAAWASLLKDAIPTRYQIASDPDWSGWLAEAPADDVPMPDVPTLAPRWWGATVLHERPQSLSRVLDQAGKAWRAYRAEVTERDAAGKGVNTPEWRITLHGPKDPRYPIAALGLPVNYHSRHPGYDGVIEPVIDGQSARRASPVWICPSQIGTEWITISHVFWARLLPEGTSLRVSGSGNNCSLSIPDRQTVELAWDHWLDHRTRQNRVPNDYRAAVQPEQTS